MGPRAFAHGDWLFSFRRILTSEFLQWGRGLSPTETTRLVGLEFRELCSSMGPRAFAHGDVSTKGRICVPRSIFNGAAGFRPRRLPPGMDQEI